MFSFPGFITLVFSVIGIHNLPSMQLFSCNCSLFTLPFLNINYNQVKTHIIFQLNEDSLVFISLARVMLCREPSASVARIHWRVEQADIFECPIEPADGSARDDRMPNQFENFEHTNEQNRGVANHNRSLYTTCGIGCGFQ